MVGNSILLQTATNRYVFIGDCVYEFSLQEGDSVVTYVSPVGNNDVPYPYIIGEKFTYLLLGSGDKLGPNYIPNSALDLSIDVYPQYWGVEKAGKGKTLVKVPEWARNAGSEARAIKKKMIAKRIY
jgi:hypothetical protein